MDAKRISSGTRERLLEAAEWLTLRDGVAKMTLDAVSREAGVSKGGLLYHFPTKDALIGGHDRAVYRAFRGRHRKNLRDEEGAGSWVRAYAKACFAPRERQQNLSVTTALVAAAANDPKLADPLRKRYGIWQRRVEDDGLEPALATLIRLAIDGAWLAELFGLASLSEKLRDDVLEELLRLGRETGADAVEKRDDR
jgi:AcrR family transcriptional regulator